MCVLLILYTIDRCMVAFSTLLFCLYRLLLASTSTTISQVLSQGFQTGYRKKPVKMSYIVGCAWDLCRRSGKLCVTQKAAQSVTFTACLSCQWHTKVTALNAADDRPPIVAVFVDTSLLPWMHFSRLEYMMRLFDIAIISKYENRKKQKHWQCHYFCLLKQCSQSNENERITIDAEYTWMLSVDGNGNKTKTVAH